MELRQYESRNLTYVSKGFPVFWERAEGANVWDVDGNRFLDLNGGFGVATLGFGSPAVVEALKNQAGTLVHGMGDVHPSRLKVELCRELSRVTFERWTGDPGKAILGCAGFEAVEAALKTARIATGKPGVLAFESGYHGLGYGAMATTGMDRFRTPFLDQLHDFVKFIPFVAEGDTCEEGDWESRLDERMNVSDIGAILVEPIQGRGGEITPVDWLLPALRRLADRHGAVLIFDEIYTGFFRSGKWFACEHWETIPDLICVGKGLSGCFPISACIGKSELMDRWPESTGEAIHTSTFLGSPLGCAAALASIQAWSERDWASEIAALGKIWCTALTPLKERNGVKEVRGRGLIYGIELVEAGAAVELAEQALARGLILLPAGEEGRVLSIKPSVVHTVEHARFTAEIMGSLFGE